MSNLSSYTKESMCDTPPKIREELFMLHDDPGTSRDIGDPYKDILTKNMLFLNIRKYKNMLKLNTKNCTIC